MATQKEQIEALAAELAEEKKATKRARTERDKYKDQVASKGEKVSSFNGHVVLSDAHKLEKEWRRCSEVVHGAYALHYDDGVVEHYVDLSSAQLVQRRNAYVKDRANSTLFATGSSVYTASIASEGCATHGFGTVARGDFTAYVAKDESGKVTAITLIAE